MNFSEEDEICQAVVLRCKHAAALHKKTPFSHRIGSTFTQLSHCTVYVPSGDSAANRVRCGCLSVKRQYKASNYRNE